MRETQCQCIVRVDRHAPLAADQKERRDRMRARRAFLTQLPLGLAGLAAACRAGGDAAGVALSATAAGGSIGAAGASRPGPLLRDVPAGAPTLRWTPEHRDLVYTFGG